MTVAAAESVELEMEFEFPAGLPAFEQERRFRLVARPEHTPLVLLESMASPGLRFVCAPVRLLHPDYRPEASEDDLALLGCGEQGAADGRLLCLAILTFPESSPPTANLLAPLLLNPDTGRGVQSIQPGGAYSHCHPVRGDAPCS